MEEFVDDDEGYIAWARQNPTGFVINAERSRNPSSLVLHRADCRTIIGTPARGKNWTAEWIKICSTRKWELTQWAREELGGKPKECGLCAP